MDLDLKSQLFVSSKAFKNILLIYNMQHKAFPFVRDNQNKARTT